MTDPSTLPSPAAIRQALEQVCASSGFIHSERMMRFLRFVVEKSLDGQASAIREYSIGIEVFDRDPSYDPKIDTIVRVEARRLRKKLDDYYAEAGLDDAVRIEMPGPGYVPRFVVNTGPPRRLAEFDQDSADGARWNERLRRWLKED